MLDDFLAEEANLLRGPYLDIGLPFRKAEEGADAGFERLKLGFRPYIHQLRAFRRLGGSEPRSTLVATGTGSGKTECFFYPILDYCASQKGPGVKAIIVYPMNALASDQSRRFAREIYEREEIRGRVTVGVYVGDSEEAPAKVMGPEQVITDKATLRENPPDILLTNYKMLDFLLLRPKDQQLWKNNEPGCLRFLVVDELHTFDGAQGTDLACLIRRLRDRLDPDNQLTCVGTSATIGGESARADLLRYASKVFASDFDQEALILEDRLRPEEFLGGSELVFTEWPGQVARFKPENHDTPQEYLRGVAVAWFGASHAPALSSTDPGKAQEARFELAERLRSCAAFRELLRQAESLIDVRYLLAEWQQQLRVDPATARALLDSLLALASTARVPVVDTQTGETRSAPFVQVRSQLWLRELTRLVSSVGPEPELRFHDDLTDPNRTLHLPTIHCRECHATGWVTVKRPDEGALQADVQEIYKAYFGYHPDCTLLFPLDGPPPAQGRGLELLVCPACAKVTAHGEPGACPDCEARADRQRVWLPNMVHTVQRGEATQRRSHHDCPYCDAREGLSLIGSRAASLSSVVIGQLFGSPYNSHDKLIAFSDSVQDAAHRSGFFGARTYRNTVRMAVGQFVAQQGEGFSLADAMEEVPHYWQERCGSAQAFVGTFIAHDMEWLRDYEALRENGVLPPGSDLPNLVRQRLAWEVLQGFGLQARVGRTLERTHSAAVGVDLAALRPVAERLHMRLTEELGQFRSLELSSVYRYLLGFLWRMRVQGAFYHAFLDGYLQRRGERFFFNQSLFLPNYGFVSRPPALLTLGPVSENFEALCKDSGGWHCAWFNKVLAGGEDVFASSEYRQAIELTVHELTRGGLLIEKRHGGEAIWGLDPARWLCTRHVNELSCDTCGNRVQVPEENAEDWAGVPCLRVTCWGTYRPQPLASGEPPYRYGQVKRLTPAEHTGLLDGETRAAVEQSFMTGQHPWDINLLSATPTLEMGIDVGDLSSILLCSVPPTQANYLQRIGRAGRRDGNALTLTVANGHNHDLYFYADPTAMISGDVRTPGVFLDATAVLERQLIAYCMDRWAAAGIDESAIPRTMRDVLNALASHSEPRVFPFNLLDFIARHRQEILQGFLALFPHLTEEAQEHLREFLVGKHGNHGHAGIDYRLTNRLHQLEQERQGYTQRIDRLKRRKDELEARPEDERTSAELEEVLAERGALMQLRQRINRTPVLNFFTDEGLLPNYAFPEEGVTLQSVIIRRRSRQERKDGDEERAYDKLNFQMQRPAQSAISELAPMNRFYAVGRQVDIDQVDLKLSPVQTWRLCDRCSYTENLDQSGDPHSACPKCGSPQWVDAGQRRQMVRLRQVYASADDRNSRIGDDNDQRTPVFFNRQMLVNVPEDGSRLAYRLSSEALPFGFEYVPRVELREINFGQPEAQQEPMSVAGERMARPGFQLCRHCGKVRRQQGRKRRGFEHAYDCRLRRADAVESDEDYLDSLYLFRELHSEAVRILLPLSEVGGPGRRLYSLIAALNLGLRRYFRGNVDHIQAAHCSEPDGAGSARRQYLVLYDRIPGGTGYLKELLRKPDNLIHLIRQAYATISQCACSEDPHRDGCYQCILAYREARRMGEISRKVAEDLLGRILAEAETLERVEGLGAIDINALIESELEQRFLHVLADTPGVVYTPEPVHGKPGAFLTFASDEDGSAVSAWKLEPQVAVGAAQGVAVQSQPDFVLWPVRAPEGTLPVAVFLDGFQYHYKVISDDTLKRQALLDSGHFRVWSLGWHDLPAPGEKVLNPTPALLGTGQQPTMQKLFTQLAGRGGWRPYHEHNHLIERGPFFWLLRYLQGGAAELQHAALSRVVGWLEPRTIQDRSVRQAVLDELDHWSPEAVREVVSDASGQDRFAFGGVLAALGEASPAVRVFAAMPLKAMSAAEQGEPDALRREAAAALSIDDEQATPDKDFEPVWRRFWGAANLFQFLPRFALSARMGLDQGVYQCLLDRLWQYPQPEVEPSDVWDEVAELSLQGEVVAQLRTAGIPVPEVGFEVQDAAGEVVAEADLAWVDAKVAIVPGDMNEDAEALEALGWSVYRGLAETQVDALLDELHAGTPPNGGQEER